MSKEINSNQEVLASIDEITLVLFANKNSVGELAEWEQKAEKMITEFSQLAKLENIFGEKMSLEDKCPQGYSIGYQFGYNPFYFAVAYHSLHPQMGVIVKFSAYSWHVYCSQGKMDIKSFLHTVRSDTYICRLSRIDFAIDYQNWDITVNDIYQNLINEHLEIHNFEGKKNHSVISGYEVDGIVDTFYVGSKKTGSRLFLRVYDKRKEQIEKIGYRCKEAAETETWVRFEAVFKSDYAHQLTKIIMDTEDKNIPDLIVNKIAEKYRFYDLKSEKYTDYTMALIRKSEIEFPNLILKSPRDNNLISSLLHLITGSGLFSTLYKCDEIWGNKTSMILLQCLHDIYSKKYTPNSDVLVWLEENKSAMQKQSLAEEIEILKRVKYGNVKDKSPAQQIS